MERRAGFSATTRDAEDAAQAAFVALALKTPPLSPGQSLGPWLHTVTVRAAFDLRKTTRRRLTREGHAVQALQTSPPAPASEIDAELERLPKKLSGALVAHYLEGWSIDDLARREGCAPSTISMRLSRGRDQLQKRLRRGESLSSIALPGMRCGPPFRKSPCPRSFPPLRSWDLCLASP